MRERKFLRSDVRGGDAAADPDARDAKAADWMCRTIRRAMKHCDDLPREMSADWSVRADGTLEVSVTIPKGSWEDGK